MAKEKKYPKMPRKSASLEVWENYRRKVHEVDAYNAKLKADAKKKDSLIRSIKQKIGRC